MVTGSAERDPRGLLDTCVLIDWAFYAPGIGPAEPMISAVSVAELAYGVALAPSPHERLRRSSYLADVRSWFEPLAFDDVAAMIYGELADAVRRVGRQPRARRLDLMIAAVAVAHGLPLVTSNGADFAGLEGVLDLWLLPPVGSLSPEP